MARFAKEDPNAEAKKAARKAAKVAATPIETVAVNVVVEALNDEMVVADW